jgi:hypothetical protein
MGWQWVNNSYSPPPSPAGIDFIFLAVLAIAVIAIVAIAFGIIWSIEAFFNWFAGKIAEKVVEKLQSKEADA